MNKIYLLLSMMMLLGTLTVVANPNDNIKWFVDFNGGSLADRTGNYADFGGNGNSFSQEGYVQEGMSNDYIYNGGTNVVIMDGNSFTLCWWMNEHQPIDPIFENNFMFNDNSYNGISIFPLYNDLLYGFNNASPIEFHHQNASGAVTLNTWQHWCTTYNSTSFDWELFRNGVSISTWNYEQPTPDGLNQLSIYRNYGATNSIALDEIGLWTTVLSPNDVNQVYLNGVQGFSYPFQEVTPITPPTAITGNFVNNLQTCNDENYNSYLSFMVITSIIFFVSIPLLKKKKEMLTWAFSVFMLIMVSSGILMVVSGCA